MQTLVHAVFAYVAYSALIALLFAAALTYYHFRRQLPVRFVLSTAEQARVVALTAADLRTTATRIGSPEELRSLIGLSCGRISTCRAGLSPGRAIQLLGRRIQNYEGPLSLDRSLALREGYHFTLEDEAVAVNCLAGLTSLGYWRIVVVGAVRSRDGLDVVMIVDDDGDQLPQAQQLLSIITHSRQLAA